MHPAAVSPGFVRPASAPSSSSSTCSKPSKTSPSSGDPAIVLADEPTGNLDIRTSTDIINLLRQLNNEGSTIIVITHDQELAATLARRVTLRDGRVIEDDSVVATR